MHAPRITVIVGDRNVTALVTALTYSNVDPGGFEACTIGLRAGVAVRPGDVVWVFAGLEVAWLGRVNDPGNYSSQSRVVDQISAVGFGAALKDNPYREIYVDRDMSRWGPISRQRRINLLGANRSPGDPVSEPDTTTGSPAIKTAWNGGWTGTSLPMYEAWYDAGQDLVIASLFYGWEKTPGVNAADANWFWQAYISAEDTLVTFSTTGTLRAAGPSAGVYYTPATARRYAALQASYDAGPAGADATEYGIHWRPLAVYGNHGLTRQGADPGGFYPTDVALDALDRCNDAAGFTVIEPGPVSTDPNLYVALQIVYDQPAPPESVVDDMMGLLGWHWGVWEPSGLGSVTPRLFLTAPPTSATIAVRRADCEDSDVPKVRLDSLFSSVDVGWQDGAGSQSIVTVTLSNPLLDETGVGPRKMPPLDIGISTAAKATELGTIALQLAQSAFRGGGELTLPLEVSAPAGRTPSCLIKSGRDRLRITDMPDPGSLNEIDTRRFDTFRVKRCETTLGEGGVPKTTVELDGGADLLEVLNARLAQGAFASMPAAVRPRAGLLPGLAQWS